MKSNARLIRRFHRFACAFLMYVVEERPQIARCDRLVLEDGIADAIANRLCNFEFFAPNLLCNIHRVAFDFLPVSPADR
jgi:hypothetical protein